MGIKVPMKSAITIGGRNPIQKDCIWEDVFTESDQSVLIAGLLFTGFISAVTALWFYSFKESMRSCRRQSLDSFRNLLTFFMASHVRIGLQLFYYFDLISKTNVLGCEVIAFLEKFLSVYEVENLTLVCVERYAVAKYISNGRQIEPKQYSWIFNLPVLFSLLYSTPPVYGFGRYTRDFSCVTCSFDMVLPQNWHRLLITSVYFLRSVKPAILMVTMLFWARKYENSFTAAMMKKGDIPFTTMTIIITAVNLICWAPMATIRGWVLVSQLLFDEIVGIPSAAYIQWAMWISTISPALSIFVVYWAYREEEMEKQN